MEQNLRSLFEQALDDDPEPPAGGGVRDAMAHGRRIRRRRRGLVVGGALAAVAAAVVVTLNVVQAPMATPEVVPAAAGMVMAPAKPNCTWPAQRDVSDVSIFLTAEVTDAERAALEAGLRSDPEVRGLRFEGRADAYARFVALWKDSPDFVASVTPASLPESFRMGLADPDAYPAFEQKFRGFAGVQDLVGRNCPGAKE